MGRPASKQTGTLTVGVDTLPPLPKDAGDRNRTSPFAFTGNRFEFRRPARASRSPGPWWRSTRSWPSRSTTSPPSWRRRTPTAPSFNAAVQKVLKEIITEHGAVIFNGDSYSEEWHEEAETRGLPNLKTTVDALPQLITPEAQTMFEKYGVLLAAKCTAATRSTSSSTC